MGPHIPGKLKKILVPVDFSPHSEYALEVAAQLARAIKAEMTVLHMLGLSESFLSGSEAAGAAEARYFLDLARKRFQTFLDKPYLKDIPISEIVQNYKIFEEVGQVAMEQQAGLIVMGSHGTGGMSEIFVGSNTEKVVRSSECPVLVIKKRMFNFQPRKILYAMDYKPGTLLAYQRARKFLNLWDAELHLVHVNLPNIQFLSSSQIKELQRKFVEKAHKGNWPENTHLAYVADYSIERGLFAYAAETGADLIAVPTHGRRGLSHFFRGSVGEDILNHAPLPVITFKV